MATHIASVFDKNYLLRALAMHTSLVEAVPDAHFWFLCLDTEVKNMAEKLSLRNVTYVLLEDLHNPALLETRKDRTIVEFAMTSKSNFLSYLIHSGKVERDDFLILTDVDIIFYPTIRDYIEKQKKNTDYSIFLTPHNFPPEKEKLIPEVGFYNGGFIFFRINDISTKCIDTWAAQCINWCYLWHDYEHGWHTDQMYIDSWKKDYPGVFDVPDKGVNVGTWNIKRYAVTEREGKLFIEGDPLVCYHFHGLKIYQDKKGAIKPYPICVYNDTIYYSYMKKLQKEQERLHALDSAWNYGFAPHPGILRLTKQKVWKIFS